MFIANRLCFYFKLKSAYVTHSTSISCACIFNYILCFFVVVVGFFLFLFLSLPSHWHGCTHTHKCDTLDWNYMAIAVSDKALSLILYFIVKNTDRSVIVLFSLIFLPFIPCCFGIDIFVLRNLFFIIVVIEWPYSWIYCKILKMRHFCFRFIFVCDWFLYLLVRHAPIDGH